MRTAKFRTYFFVIVALLLLKIILVANCQKEQRPQILANVDACTHCNMMISKLNQACGYFFSGEFIPFDSPVCLMHEFDVLRKKDNIALPSVYFADFCDSKFISAESTYFLFTKHIPTVMNAGIICFADKDSAIQYQKHQNEKIVEWKMFQAISCSPDTNISAILSLQGLDPQTVLLKKNQLVEWTFTGKGLKTQVDLILKGYEEFGSISITADGKPVKYKILASRPGTGFAFFTNDGATPFGMVKISGAHTKDEEVM